MSRIQLSRHVSTVSAFSYADDRQQTRCCIHLLNSLGICLLKLGQSKERRGLGHTNTESLWELVLTTTASQSEMWPNDNTFASCNILSVKLGFWAKALTEICVFTPAWDWEWLYCRYLCHCLAELFYNLFFICLYVSIICLCVAWLYVFFSLVYFFIEQYVCQHDRMVILRPADGEKTWAQNYNEMQKATLIPKINFAQKIRFHPLWEHVWSYNMSNDVSMSMTCNWIGYELASKVYAWQIYIQSDRSLASA